MCCAWIGTAGAGACPGPFPIDELALDADEDDAVAA